MCVSPSHSFCLRESAADESLDSTVLLQHWIYCFPPLNGCRVIISTTLSDFSFFCFHCVVMVAVLSDAENLAVQFCSSVSLLLLLFGFDTDYSNSGKDELPL